MYVHVCMHSSQSPIPTYLVVTLLCETGKRKLVHLRQTPKSRCGLAHKPRPSTTLACLRQHPRKQQQGVATAKAMATASDKDNTPATALQSQSPSTGTESSGNTTVCVYKRAKLLHFAAAVSNGDPVSSTLQPPIALATCYRSRASSSSSDSCT